jgi:hypothetical protein
MLIRLQTLQGSEDADPASPPCRLLIGCYTHMHSVQIEPIILQIRIPSGFRAVVARSRSMSL